MAGNTPVAITALSIVIIWVGLVATLALTGVFAKSPARRRACHESLKILTGYGQQVAPFDPPSATPSASPQREVAP